MRRSSAVLILLTALPLGACSDDAQPPSDGPLAQSESGPGPRLDQRVRDGARGDARVEARRDQLATPDAGHPDAPAAAFCNTTLDLSPLKLDPSYCVVSRFTSSAMPQSMNYRANQFWIVDVTNGKPWPVNQIKVDPKTGLPQAPSTIFSFGPTGTVTGKPAANQYLALSQSGSSIAVGWTDTAPPYNGEIFWSSQGGTPEVVKQATGNYDIIFLDEKSLLVNGTGVGTAQSGQGVYLVRAGQPPLLLVKDLGSLSGFMARGNSVLFMGGYFGSKGNQIYGFSLAEVQAAIAGGKTMSSADGDLVYQGPAMDATALGDDLVVSRMGSYSVTAVTRLPVTVSGNTVKAGQGQDILTPTGSEFIYTLAGAGDQLAISVSLTSKSVLFAVVQPK